MQISTLVIVAVTTVVITDIVTAVDKMGGVDVFWFVMEDRWMVINEYRRGSERDSELKRAFYECLHDQAFDFGTTSDDRQARFGYGCSKYTLLEHVDAFFKFDTVVSNNVGFCHGEMPADPGEQYENDYNSISPVLSKSRDYVFNDMRQNVTLVSIVIAGREVKHGHLNIDSQKFEEDGNVLFIVTLASPLNTTTVGSVPDYRILHFNGTCTTDFVEKFHQAICRPRTSVNFNATECVLKSGATSICHRNVTYTPEVKRFDVICQKYPLKVTDEECPCNGTTHLPEATTAKSLGPETTTQSAIPAALITGIVIGVVIVIIVVIAIVIVVMVRRRERQRRILATKMVIGDVTKSQMSRASAYGGKSQMSLAKSARTRSVLAKMQKKRDESQAAKKTQQSKSQMLKTQQQKSHASKLQTPKLHISKSQVPQKSSRMSKSPSSKVKAGKSQMSRSPLSKIGKSQMGKGSKMSPK